MAATKDGDLVFEGAWGLRDRDNGLPVTPDSLFRMASVTKPISAMAMMTLVDEDKVQLDADIGEYLGYQVRNPRWPDVPVTLRQLMTHTSTLVERGSYNKILAGGMPAYKLSEVLQHGSLGDDPDNWLPDRPGTRYDYSSFGSGVMGAVGGVRQRCAGLVKQRVLTRWA